MRSGTGLALLLAAAAAGGGCGTIPPYSSVREQEVEGLNAIKLRGAFWQNTQIESKDLVFPIAPDAGYELDRYSSYGIEFERLLSEKFPQWSVTFAYETRDMEIEGTTSPVQGEQIHAGMRRYFGDRALTGFLAAQLIYHQSLDFPGELGLGLRESDDFLGWGAGGGANLALSEHFTIEAYLMYEGAPGVNTYKRRTDGPGAPADREFFFSGPVAYLGVGYHF